MKNKTRTLAVFLILISSALAANAAGEKGEWVRIPTNWLLHRFVRPSSAAAHTYKVALVVPPHSKQPKVAQSSGLSDVDQLAGDFAVESILNNAALKTLSQSKELYFQFVITPPQLDVNMRSVEGKRPPPPGKEIYAPTADTFYTNANQNETTSRRGNLTVIFPPEGGHASEAIVTLSTGSPAVDRYYLHSAALNWQTTRKSSKEQVLRTSFGAAAPQRWQSIYDR
ncbi:MAG: hypothetical protein QOG51_804 [Verrucomicrobiota bacterium]|jgi:hypothetical protein